MLGRDATEDRVKSIATAEPITTKTLNPGDAPMARSVRRAVHPISKRLEAVRELHGISLAEFRKQLYEGHGESYSYQTIQNYHYDREPPVRYLVRVADIFGVSLIQLATGKEERSLFQGEPDPEFAGPFEEYDARLRQTRFVGPLEQAAPWATGIRQLASEMAPKVRFGIGSLEKGLAGVADVTESLDSIYAGAWVDIRQLIVALGGRDDFTIDQQLRFAAAMVTATRAMLGDRGMPGIDVIEEETT